MSERIAKERIYLTGDVPGGNMVMFKDSSMKTVNCLVRRFLDLSPDHSMKDLNNVRVTQSGWFILLLEDINILRSTPAHSPVRISIQSQSPKVKLED